MKRLVTVAAVLVTLAFGIREGIDYFRTSGEREMAERRARLILEEPHAGDFAAASMWDSGYQRMDAPAEVLPAIEAARRSWLAEKRIQKVGSVEIAFARRESEHVMYGQSTWIVGVRVDGRELAMRLTRGERAEWVDAAP